MRILVRAAAIQNATRLVKVKQAHIDSCIFIGRGGLSFAQLLADWGGRVAVPTTLNAISIDQRKWRESGIATSLGEPSSQLADAYVRMGAQPSFTCAPYLLDSAPGYPNSEKVLSLVTSYSKCPRSLTFENGARVRGPDRLGRIKRCHFCQQCPRRQNPEVRRLSGRMCGTDGAHSQKSSLYSASTQQEY